MKRAASTELLAGPDRSNKKSKTAQTLDALLDCSFLTTQSELEERFAEIADVLCNRTHLRLYTNHDGQPYA